VKREFSPIVIGAIVIGAIAIGPIVIGQTDVGGNVFTTLSIKQTGEQKDLKLVLTCGE
jgi:hypothetical protein